jgi:hypothetical protein
MDLLIDIHGEYIYSNTAWQVERTCRQHYHCRFVVRLIYVHYMLAIMSYHI